MSDARSLTRLRWHNGQGFACHDGVQVQLRSAPDLGIAGVTEIDYEPGCCAELRLGCETRRELDSAEMGKVLALLKRMAEAARAALEATP